MPLITPGYLQQQKWAHEDHPQYGTSGHKWADKIQAWAQQLGSRDILDYGSGRQTLQKALPWPIHQYDPATPGYDALPAPADFLVVSDVLEHIEPECLDDVLDHLAELTKKLIFMAVATRPAIKFMRDGRNMHVIQEDPDWWLPKIMARFDVQSYQRMGEGEFVVLAFPKVKPAEPQE